MISVAVISVVGLLNLILGITTLLKTRRDPSAFYYFLISLITVLWVLPLTFLEFTTNNDSRLLLAKAAFIGPSFLPFALYGFTSNFPRNLHTFKRGTSHLFALLGAIFLAVSLFGTHFITAVRPDSFGGFIYTYGYQYTIYFLFLAGGIFYLLTMMYLKYRSAIGLDQLRMRYLLTGFTISAGGALLTNMVLPMFGLDSLSAFGPVSTIFLFYFTTQAIIYHRLFDIGTFVANLVEVVALTAFFYGVIFAIRTFELKILHLSFYDPLNIFIDLVFAFTISSNIRFILRFIAKVVGRLLISEKIQVEEISHALDTLRTKTLSMADYLCEVAELLNNKIPRLRASFRQEKEFTEKLQLLRFAVGKLYLQQELPKNQKQHRFLANSGYGLLMRISPEISLIMDEKNGQYAYTKQEIDAIAYLTQRLKIALVERALFEQAKNFNALLERKVEVQTRKLVRANKKLKELDKAKSDFISMASHQLRTPISVIRGYLSMIMSGDLGNIPKEIADSLARVIRNTDQLNSIVEDILNASRIEQSRLVINLDSGDFTSTVSNAIEELKAKAANKGLTLSGILPKRKITLPFDQTKIYEAILNLIDNALSYTKQGSVTVMLSEDKDYVKVSVTDTGIGIPDDKKDYIFKRFSRLENAKEVRPDGTGIGLFIAKEIVSAHNGKIGFSSKLNKGSTFWLQLPKAHKE